LRAEKERTPITLPGESGRSAITDNERTNYTRVIREGPMRQAARQFRNEQGFTLIELLIVIVILSILLMIALPGYLSFRTRANDSAAKSAIREVVPAVVLFNGDHKSGYVGLTTTALKTGYGFDVKKVSIFLPTATSYCLKSRVGISVWYKGGPAGDITSTKPTPACP
jgi:prepilin-type N-terminal cleavage/methylation domain-containing protein